MRCEKCGDNIKYQNGRWYHYTKHHHWAVPPDGADPFNSKGTTPIEKEARKFRNVLIQLIWIFLTVGGVILAIFVLKLLIKYLSTV